MFTSNVNGQFQATGFDADLMHECHGSIHHLQCLEPCGRAIWSTAGFEPEVDEAACELRGVLPLCPHCGGLARPNILMFGDGGWVADREQQQARRLRRWLAGVQRPVVLELGARLAVPTVRHFSEALVRHAGARLLRINPRECEVPGTDDVGLPLGALAGLQAVDALLG